VELSQDAAPFNGALRKQIGWLELSREAGRREPEGSCGEEIFRDVEIKK